MSGSDASKTKVTPEHTCAFCGSSTLSEVIDFGTVALAGGFLKKRAFSQEKKYPLVIVFCRECYAVQVRDHIDPKILFSTDFYFSSTIKTLRDHFADYASEVTARFLAEPGSAVVVEIGSNDGVLLRPLADQGIGKVIGVDPAKNIVDSIQGDQFVLINDFFDAPVASGIVEKFGKADLVMANNVFAHITDINGTTEAVLDVLADEGVFVLEVHYLGKIIEDLQYDMMYHEHIYYYSLIALENHFARHDMVIFDIKPVPTHGGSLRFYVAKKGSDRGSIVSSPVDVLREQEIQLGYHKPETYEKFALRVAGKREELMTLLDDLRGQGRTIAGYGASGRANTMIQYCGITRKDLDYVIDDSPAKQGLFTPGSHLEIRGNQALEIDKPDYVLLFAWAFYEEILSKCKSYIEDGGAIIVPLPEVSITRRSNGMRPTLV